MWVTAMTAPSAARIADHKHVIASFLTGFDGTRKVFDAYRARYAELGRPAPADDRFAYAALVYTGRTDEEGIAGAEKLMWYVKANKVPFRSAYDFNNMTLTDMIDNGIVFAGSADTVREQVEKFYSHVGGFGHLLLTGQAGFLEHDRTVRGIETFASEVKPKLAAHA